MITKKCGYRLISLLFIVCLSVSPARAQYDVVPMPQSIALQKGEPFTLWNDLVQIVAPEELKAEAGFLQAYLKDITGSTLPIASKRNKGMTYIELALSPKVTEPEGYVLTINKKGVTIVGGSAAGVFYGIQTLRKAVVNARQSQHITELTNKPSVSSSTPPFTHLYPVVITDAPRFSWRGMHLDCSRHFFPVAFVKKFIDLLALHNMNVFHWHLTDDQGWRIEIKKWPRLTTVGSQRSGTIIGTNSDLDDGIPYGGFYTQAEAREIVAYAAARHITIVPEIDMPGHMLAALAAYPELGCTGGPYQVGHYWGVYKDVLCMSNPRTYEFVQDVLTEVMDIFPSEVIHIGGDETPTEKWNQCEKCSGFFVNEALKGRFGGAQAEKQSLRPADNYQAVFTERVFNFLTSKGRRALGWDEILDGAPQDAMIMSWRGSAPGAKAAEAGHDVVMTPTTHCYFDYQQVEDTQFEPSRCGGFIPIEKVYSLDPAPDSLSVEARSHILGTQANLWTEYMTNEQMVEYQALPRMSALAEVQWTQPARKNYPAFLQRLTRFTSLLEQYHYTYAKHLWPDRQIPNRWQF
ncbi:MAG: beta-N-acetylhexosaminidase [Prevotella sp.]|nr:beta-N-acetylhexosaminidase [Prevotella sp.]